MKRLLLTSASALLLTSVSVAQPPNVGRWTNDLASPQPQGYSQGSPAVITWGFMQLNTPINDGNNAPNNLQTFLNGIYGGGQAQWQPLFQSVFDRWSAVSGVSYVFEANDDGQAMTNTSGSPAGSLGIRPDIRIGGKLIDGNSNVLAYNYGPNHGDMVIDTGDNFYSNNLANNSRALRNVVAHEHGHGLGMPHLESNNASFLMEPFINLGFDGPQHHDILAAHRSYGDFNEKSFAGQGNDVFGRATAMGNIAVGNSASVGNSARTLVVAPTAVDFVSIDGSSDTDFYSFSVTSASRVDVLLEALGFNYNATPQNGGGNVAWSTLDRSNLALALFDTDGITLLASANLTGLGGNESLFFILNAAGTYFVRVTGTDNPDASALDTQFYGLTVSISAIPEPMAVALVGIAGLGGAGSWWYRRRQRQLLMNQSVDRI
ncbi:MAG: matrixin family metalloprotease [Planctomycetia bacterium]|nr:matrixin family metalloprotease [Planctomycetia bacterium]